jgi:signal transduction histidine kinase
MGREKEWMKMLDMLDRNSERLRNSIDQILQLSRIGGAELKTERTYLRELLNDAYKEHLPLAKIRGIDLIIYVEPMVVIGDRNLLKLAVNNLVSNAVKFTNHGSVTIRAKALDDSISISIADTGIGISPENQKHIFEKFFKADPSAPGTGIGLTIIKQIVEKHGGRINVKSVLGKGSTFEIILPREGGGKKQRRKRR